jgi:hypothetical protein
MDFIGVIMNNWHFEERAVLWALLYKSDLVATFNVTVDFDVDYIYFMSDEIEELARSKIRAHVDFLHAADLEDKRYRKLIQDKVKEERRLRSLEILKEEGL